ncbi:MAG: ATP-binding protein [Alphaproteobacteria bacterium]
MPQKTYTTLDDVRTIVTEQIQEGINLEYKGSSVLVNRDANTVCKTVSALANSAGGTFIIGIEMKDLLPVRIDDGTPGPSKRDWIYQIINSGTFPAVEAVEIREFQAPSGTIYVIEVPLSPQAPHQSNDRKYYKRRGSHSEVMEHYEIEDVRNRPKRALMPLRVELHTQGILAYLRLANSHETDAVTQLRCEIDANFSLGHDGLAVLRDRGLRALLPGSELHFLLGSMIEVLQTQEPTITFKFSYAFHEATMAQSVTFYLADLDRTAIVTSPVERVLETLGNKIDKATDQLRELHRSAETLTSAVDGTGLRVSQRTLRT